MRRKDREITDYTQITAIMDACDACRLGLCENNTAYIVPLCFGYKLDADNHMTLYFHSASEGRKLDLIRQNSSVAFEMDTAHDLFDRDQTACGYGMRYKSVMGTGTARLITAKEEKLTAFRQIMAHYTSQDLPFSDAGLDAATIIEVDVTSLSCKVHA